MLLETKQTISLILSTAQFIKKIALNNLSAIVFFIYCF